LSLTHAECPVRDDVIAGDELRDGQPEAPSPRVVRGAQLTVWHGRPHVIRTNAAHHAQPLRCSTRRLSRDPLEVLQIAAEPTSRHPFGEPLMADRAHVPPVDPGK